MIHSKNDKIKLHNCITLALESLYDIAIKAAQQAYETATNVETKAENKYDTFSLEASYLAQGQSKRVEENLNNIKQFKELNIIAFENDGVISVGHLVLVSNKHNKQHYYFISPVAGGLKIEYNNHEILLITPNAPLGKALVNSQIGEEVYLNNHDKQPLYILAIY